MEEKLLLSLLENNAILTVTDLSMALNESEEAVASTIKELENRKVICGYHTLINWDRTNQEAVKALIQIRTNPERDYGYDRIAEKIYRFPEVDTMYLLSGETEFLVIINGKTMQEIAKFVGSKLAPIDAVTGTSTLFVLKQYKKNGVCFDEEQDKDDERLVVTP
ncbi:MAG: Lrp/AsnC family transcriptional regulator [Coprobacillaceae bacterium]